jgi:hypothetical protein
MNKKENQKLSIKKFQISKINNPQYILGGGADRPKTRPTMVKDEI